VTAPVVISLAGLLLGAATFIVATRRHANNQAPWAVLRFDDSSAVTPLLVVTNEHHRAVSVRVVLTHPTTGSGFTPATEPNLIVAAEELSLSKRWWRLRPGASVAARVQTIEGRGEPFTFIVTTRSGLVVQRIRTDIPGNYDLGASIG
jgi:hypothetical protein